MKKFPVTIVDNFYENPELVRDFALSQKFYPSDGAYPGERSEGIHNLNQDFFQNFCEKLFSLFYDLETAELSWNVETTFQKIGKLSNDRNSKLNAGWIHSDSSIFSGVIYLSKNSTGTSIYYPKDADSGMTCQDQKHLFYSGKTTNEDEYALAIEKNNNNFYESIRVDGKFNRLVLFEGGVYHGVPSFFGEDDFRLTQVFFVNEIASSKNTANYPIIRSKVR